MRQEEEAALDVAATSLTQQSPSVATRGNPGRPSFLEHCHEWLLLSVPSVLWTCLQAMLALCQVLTAELLHGLIHRRAKPDVQLSAPSMHAMLSFGCL